MIKTEISIIKDPVQRLFAFACERHEIFLKRQEGRKPPWTNDEILANYRFCNVYREDDKVTTWIRNNWRNPHSSDPDLWFAMCVARTFNKPESLEVIGYPVPFDTVRNAQLSRNLLRYKQRTGKPIFNGAYIISPGGYGVSTSKLGYVWQNLCDIWKNRNSIRPREGDSLNSFHMVMQMQPGFGSFMAAQVVADIKYHPPLNKAVDWETFAASGPGSRRGLNYVMGFKEKLPEDDFRLELGRLREQLLPMFKRAQMPRPHAQDIQNLLCEWGKYWRAVTKGQMPKQKYRIGEENDCRSI